MKRLTPYAKDVFLAYDESIKKKHKEKRSILQNAKIQIGSSYRLYQASLNKGILGIPKSTGSLDLKESLHHCYSSKTSEFCNIIAEIKSIQPTGFQSTYCQYCGISHAGSFDHYFPKEDYYYYTILPINLVPACSECNVKKGKNIYSKSGHRQIINYYYDDVEAAQFLDCDVTFQNEIVLFDYSIDPLFLTSPFGLIVSEHFRLLDLYFLFKECASTPFGELSLDFNGVKSNLGELQRLIDEKIDTSGTIFGINHFKTALLRGLRKSIVNYQNYLINFYP